MEVERVEVVVVVEEGVVEEEGGDGVRAALLIDLESPREAGSRAGIGWRDGRPHAIG